MNLLKRQRSSPANPMHSQQSNDGPATSSPTPSTHSNTSAPTTPHTHPSVLCAADSPLSAAQSPPSVMMHPLHALPPGPPAHHHPHLPTHPAALQLFSHYHQQQQQQQQHQQQQQQQQHSPTSGGVCGSPTSGLSMGGERSAFRSLVGSPSAAAFALGLARQYAVAASLTVAEEQRSRLHYAGECASAAAAAAAAAAAGAGVGAGATVTVDNSSSDSDEEINVHDDSDAEIESPVAKVARMSSSDAPTTLQLLKHDR